LRAPRKGNARASNTEITVKFPTIALLAAAASFFAASLSNANAASHRGHHARGHNAYASAAASAGASPGEPDAARAAALRECTKSYAHMYEQTWGAQQSLGYAACMASHGQME
jgi:hypothetical protein